MFDPDAIARDLIARRLARVPLPNKAWIQLSNEEMRQVKVLAKRLGMSEAQTRRALLLRGLQVESEKR